MNANEFRTARVKLVKLPMWQVVLAGAVIIAIGIALAVVAAGLFLIVFPALLVAVGAWRLFGGRRRQAASSRPGDPTVIETEYEVIDPERRR